jgi:hypothetical protein
MDIHRPIASSVARDILMPINHKNLRQKEINKLKNTVRTLIEQTKQYGDRRNVSNGVFTGGAYQLNRISSLKCTATMGGSGTCVAP